MKVVPVLQQGAFPLIREGNAASILIDTTDIAVVRIAVQAVATDIEMIGGNKPSVRTTPGIDEHSLVIAGTIGHSAVIDELVKAKKLDVSKIQGKWESYTITTIRAPMKGVAQALVIAGSDGRGTAYGLFELSHLAGVSPWVWWADVIPEKRKNLSVLAGTLTSNEPSVKYRGIFINDEDWGLQPWAAKTFEPETGDIGPKTYARVFELLLRLKANFIWTAMHPGTKAFFHYPGNVKMAELYQIVIGSSHAEPMLRNNVSEWDEKNMGHFNYLTNKEKVYHYWEDRVKESSKVNAIYSLGMRGVHDSPIEGVKTPKEAVPLIEQIFAEQRGLFEKYINPDATKVPQVFTPYKEVLDIYANGLKVPEDVTLMWPDDNYGYIQRLSNEKEKERSGGSGVYYHASYWGRPHDYLWLSTTHPALIREEMMKAYEMNARKIWVLNAGDIKPAEYTIQLFMDMAYRVDSFQTPAYSKTHLEQWTAATFGKTDSKQIANILWKYYDLAWERKPEYMGWSQTEPTTKTKFTAYNHFYYGDQAQKRISAYKALESEAIALGKNQTKEAAYYQLVEYPVVGAALMNQKFLYHDRAAHYAEQSRLSFFVYDSLIRKAYNEINRETYKYNTGIAGGKWKGVMDMKPRRLPVFDLPVDSVMPAPAVDYWRVVPEGQTGATAVSMDDTAHQQTLPVFQNKSNRSCFFDVFLTTKPAAKFTVSTTASWITVSAKSFQLSPSGLKSEKRIWVSIDWTKVPDDANSQGAIVVKDTRQQYTIQVKVQGRRPKDLIGFKGFVETDHYLSIYAGNYTGISNRKDRRWQVIDRIGGEGKAIESLPLQFIPTDSIADEAVIRKAPSVTYNFFTFDTATAAASIYTLPTAPLNSHFGMRYAVTIDDGPLQILNFKTAGRSEEWKQNVLSNSAVRTVQQFLQPGKHKLTIYMIDPGVFIQNIFINLGQQQPFYGTLPETGRNN